MSQPMMPQQCQGAVGQGHVAIFAAFSLNHVDHLAITVDIFHPQLGSFQQAQSASIDRMQANLI